MTDTPGLSPTNAFPTLLARARDWFERARSTGWLDAADAGRLAAVEQATPADLFVDSQARPLVVAFFGGTGVGKSSLLNRLIGEPIARTGLERPTSREVTLYVHESIELADLPPGLPVTQVRCERHTSDDRRDALWIDAPDIDSTYEDNRRCALRWLPHIDLLVYVVSPERYRDDVGWRVLLQRGHKHGWMFVMNRWDEGDATQRDDFARMLRGAGFEAPLLLCTCCARVAEPLPTPDQFDRIESTIRDVLREHGVRELERLGHRARLLELRGAVNGVLPRFGSERHWPDFASVGERHWQRSRTAILEGVEWPMRTAAGRLAVRESGFVGQVVRQVKRVAGSGSDPDQHREASTARGPGDDEHAPTSSQQRQPAQQPPDAGELSHLTDPLWDEWTQSKLDAARDVLEVELRRAQVAADPLRHRLDATAQTAGTLVREQVQDELRRALAAPGTALERTLRRLTGFLMVFLPAVALAWVGWVVVRRYYLATVGSADFLGVPFAVHSVGLVLAAWGLPYLLDRSLRPSLERAALRAMRRGFTAGLDEVGAGLAAAIQEAAREGQAYREEAKAIVADLSRVVIQPIEARSATLGRLVATRLHRQDAETAREPAAS